MTIRLLPVLTFSSNACVAHPAPGALLLVVSMNRLCDALASCGRWWSSINQNVQVALLQSAGSGVADSIWTTTVLSSFIFVLADDSNTVVGVIEMIQGLTTLIVALPMGWLADRFSKAGVIRIGGIFCIIALLATSAVVFLASDKEDSGAADRDVKALLIALGGCACIWGVVDAVLQGPAPALFADSLPTGSRSRWYSYAFIVNMAGRTVGPAVTIVMFSFFGDTWTLPEIRTVFLAGMLVELINSPTFFLYDDTKALESASSASLTETLLNNEEDREIGEKAVTQEPLKVAPRIPGKGCIGGFLGLRPEHVPYVLFANDVVVAFGSGMTIKFFPLFWKEEVGLSPAQVQAIFLLVPIAIAGSSALAVLLSKRIGRIFAMLTVKFVGISFLVLMVILKDRVPALALIAFYLIRTGLVNSTYPLEESVLMDFVPSDTRARWKSLQSVTMFGWCGSAALGGILGDSHGYDFTFLITAALQGTGACMLIFIAHLVPLETNDENSGLKREDKGEYQPVLGTDSEDSTMQPTTSLFWDESVLSTSSEDNGKLNEKESGDIVVDFQAGSSVEEKANGFSATAPRSPGRFGGGAGYHTGKVYGSDED